MTTTAAKGDTVRKLASNGQAYIVDRVNRKTVSAHRIQDKGGITLLAHGSYVIVTKG